VSSFDVIVFGIGIGSFYFYKDCMNDVNQSSRKRRWLSDSSHNISNNETCCCPGKSCATKTCCIHRTGTQTEWTNNICTSETRKLQEYTSENELCTSETSKTCLCTSKKSHIYTSKPTSHNEI
jgi:hypothetical protein